MGEATPRGFDRAIAEYYERAPDSPAARLKRVAAFGHRGEVVFRGP